MNPDDQDELLAAVKRRHFLTNRIITASFVVLLGLAALILWWLNIEYVYHGQVVGVVLMLLAFILYQIPYLSYRITRFRMRDTAGAEAIFAGGWKDYKKKVGQLQ